MPANQGLAPPIAGDSLVHITVTLITERLIWVNRLVPRDGLTLAALRAVYVNALPHITFGGFRNSTIGPHRFGARGAPFGSGVLVYE